MPEVQSEIDKELIEKQANFEMRHRLNPTTMRGIESLKAE